MIAIFNTGERDQAGRHKYRLQINHELIAEFYHHRPYGLAVCLHLAAEAAEQAHADKVDRLLALAESTDRGGQHD